MKIHLISFYILSILLLSFSCNKEDIADGTPICIENSIIEFKSNCCEEGANVKEYSFQGEAVYVFDPGTCGADMTSEVKDAECVTLGYLGGISGNSTINGEDFSSAIFVKTTWKK